MKRSSHRTQHPWLGALIVLPLLVSGCGRDAADRVADVKLASNPSAVIAERDLPPAGTEIPLLPPGEARSLAQTHCLACHSSEMMQQQRLTDVQWQSEVDKMQRWGADVRDEDKAALVAYLASRFGPDNDRFTPVVARPQTQSSDSAPPLARRPQG